jgi:UDP-N-acetylmuramoyl-L-alanyl-D-glutamate--2,6-diaminopimelate ligase
MTLSSLLQGVTVAKMFQTMYGRMVTTHDIEVHGLQYDSRKIQRGDLFVAIKGTLVDGHKFIDLAIANGAKAVVIEDDAVLPDSFFMHAGVVKIVVGDTRRALAIMSGNFFGHPARKLKLIGVTGTNGKTTTMYLIKQLLESSPSLRGKVGMIGTIEYMVGDKRIPATHTTPESLELNQLFVQMVEKQCTHVVMEVSSHSLQQNRVHGLEFAAAVFTNLTQDHLDYHGTMERYFASKKILFDNLPASSSAVANADDAWGLKIVRNTNASSLTYGIVQNSDVHATNISLSIDSTKFVIEHQNEKMEIQSQLVGRFNVQNILAACSVGIALGISKPAIQSGVASLTSVPGRFERVVSPAGWSAIIDYAHTPDALEKCLSTIHDVLPPKGSNKIITVFGAGGDRDKTKRPLMGKIVDALSDVIIVTSDNPRTENPQTIIDDVRAGIQRKENVYTDVERRSAITKALSMAQRGDVVLIAGKGHEDYQVIGTTKHHFSDREVVSEVIAAYAR